MIVRALIPDAMSPGDPYQSESLRVNYATLDRPGQATRIRLNSTVIHARHVGAAPHLLEPDSREVEVTYVTAGKGYTVTAKDVIMAGNTNMIPYIVPDLPADQKAALHLSVRACQAPVTMMLRNWEAFEKLKVAGIRTPLAFFDSIRLQSSRSFGEISPVRDPAQPILVTIWGGELGSYAYAQELTDGALPKPGTDVREQLRILRRGLYKTSFETFERHARKLMGGALAGAGFDPARDITAITVNRWGHGYCLGQNALFDDESKTPPFVIGRRKFGRIAIANSDSSGIDNAQTAMDEGARAVRELEPRNYGYYSQI
jgi:spermidine dehydrogenase